MAGEATATSILPVSDTCNERARSVIDNLDVANTVFTPKCLDVYSKIRQETRNELIDGDLYSQLKSTFSSEFDNLTDDDSVIWEERSRRHLAQQPFIKDEVIRREEVGNNI